jgi:CubicO group peptidase (beta-lactamase class C family)
MRRWLSLLSLLCLASTLPAQDAKFAELTQRFVKFVADKDTSGAVLLIGKKDSIPYFEAIGQANVATGTAMKKDSLFRIASMTKPITAMAVMMLQDEGKLNVEDAVEKYLPEFKAQLMVQSTDKEKGTVTLGKPKRAITIRDLLTHTSGLAAYPAGLADLYTKRNRTLAESTLAVSQLPLMFEPGTKWSYCNSGIDTLGRIIEVTSGMSYEQFLQTRIFYKLKMTNTTFYPTPKQLERMATLYGKDKEKLVEVPNAMITMPKNAKHPIPAGGLVSCAEDLARLYECLLRGTEINGEVLIKKASFEAMTKTQTGDIATGFTDGMSFGFGFAVVKEPKGVTAMLSPGTYGHGGAFGTQGWIDPKNDVFFVLLIQRNGLPNGDASDMRKEFQTLGMKALAK